MTRKSRLGRAHRRKVQAQVRHLQREAFALVALQERIKRTEADFFEVAAKAEAACDLALHGGFDEVQRDLFRFAGEQARKASVLAAQMADLLGQANRHA